MDQLVCFWGASAPVYKGAKGEGAAGQEEGAGGILVQLGLGGGVLLPEGVGLLLRPPPGRRPPPPWLLYILRQRHPRNTQVDPPDLYLSRGRCPYPPYTSIIL